MTPDELTAFKIMRLKETIAELVNALRPFADAVSASKYVDIKRKIQPHEWNTAAWQVSEYDARAK